MLSMGPVEHPRTLSSVSSQLTRLPGFMRILKCKITYVLFSVLVVSFHLHLYSCYDMACSEGQSNFDCQMCSVII